MTAVEQPVLVSRFAMRTRFEIALYGAAPERLLAAGEGALDEIARAEQRLSKFLPGSDIWVVNENAAKHPVTVDPRTMRLLSLAEHIWQETSGAFDVTVGPLMRAWGFVDGEGHNPSPDELLEARAACGMPHVRLNEEDVTVTFDIPGVEIDMGAIGKGYAVDQAAAFLRDCGVTCALIHGGTSSIYAIGAPPEDDAWKLKVRHPNQHEDNLGQVLLCDNSLSVSAVHGKSFMWEGKLYHHVLDPRTGTPTSAALLAAVVCPSATEGDALSTALLVAGTGLMNEMSECRPEASALVVASGKDNTVEISNCGPAFFVVT